MDGWIDEWMNGLTFSLFDSSPPPPRSRVSIFCVNIFFLFSNICFCALLSLSYFYFCMCLVITTFCGYVTMFFGSHFNQFVRCTLLSFLKKREKIISKKHWFWHIDMFSLTTFFMYMIKWKQPVNFKKRMFWRHLFWWLRAYDKYTLLPYMWHVTNVIERW